MKNGKTPSEDDREKLGRLKIFSWLSPAEIKVLEGSLYTQTFRRSEVGFRESGLIPLKLISEGTLARSLAENLAIFADATRSHTYGVT
jgi:hypothetical protein